MGSTSSATTTRDTILAQKERITRIVGDIDADDVDNLEEELGAILVTIKSTHFPQGAKYGHLPVILGQERMRTILGDAAYLYVAPTHQGDYDPNAITATVAVRAQLEAQLKAKNVNNEIYVGVEAGTTDLIEYAVGTDPLSPLKKRFIGLGDETPQTIIKFLRTKVCLKMTTAEKDAYKREGLAEAWDVTKNISGYFKHLEDLKDRMTTRDIQVSDDDIVMAAVARMFESGYFTEEKMIEWESKPNADKTWANVKIFFTKLYQDREQFSKATAKTSEFRERANLAKQAARSGDSTTATSSLTHPSTTEETAMMMAALQEAHQDQINKMQDGHDRTLSMATQAMQKMADQMKAMTDMQAQLSSAASVYTPIPTDVSLKTMEEKSYKSAVAGGGGGNNNGTRVNKFGVLQWDKQHKCKNCDKYVFHFEQDCHSLPENKAKKAEFDRKCKEERSKTPNK